MLRALPWLACRSAPGPTAPAEPSTDPAAPTGGDHSAAAPPGDSAGGASDPTGDTGPAPLLANRDRLLAGDLAFLRADPTRARSHGLRGGDGATPTSPGSGGGGESDRLMRSVDATLHAALLAAHANQGRPGSAGVPDLADLADLPPGGSWRDSHDLAGPHPPFTRSVETEDGAPRGQAHVFADPTSEEARAPLGRRDLEGLVDPYALEVDQDFDCVHSSNPDCSYTFHGPLCAPRPTRLGTEIHERNDGSWDPTWAPAGC